MSLRNWRLSILYKLDPVPGPRYLIRVVTMQPAPPQFDLCHPLLPGLAHIVCWSLLSCPISHLPSWAPPDLHPAAPAHFFPDSKLIESFEDRISRDFSIHIFDRHREIRLYSVSEYCHVMCIFLCNSIYLCSLYYLLLSTLLISIVSGISLSLGAILKCVSWLKGFSRSPGCIKHSHSRVYTDTE